MSLACIITAVFQFVQISGNATVTGGLRVVLGYIEVSCSVIFLNAQCLIQFFFLPFSRGACHYLCVTYWLSSLISTRYFDKEI